MLASISSKKKIIIVALISCTIFACTRPKSGVEAVLAAAGSNRAELAKVIAHYENKGDSLKLKAALFLIENMDWGYSYAGEQVEHYDAIFSEICGMATGRGVEAVFKEYEAKYGQFDTKNLKILKDANHVTADFLIENMDLAFEAWRTQPWAKDIDFELFCQSILPYRIGNEPLENWRPLFINHYKWLKDSLKGETDVRRVFGVINHYVATDFQVTTRWRYPFLPKYSHLIDCKAGTCDIMSSLMIAAMRAQGIPAFKDAVPKWGNKDYGHAWAVVLDKAGNPYWCYGEHDTLARNDTLAPSSHLALDTMGLKYLPAGLVVDTVKTIPKIYRFLFHKDPDHAKLMADEYASEMIPFFRNPHLKDVTTQYLKNCKDVTVQLKDVPKRAHFAYLGVFDKQDWQPVATAKINNNQAYFKNMGQDLLYLPMAIVNNKSIPIGSPFVLKNGKITPIIPDFNNKQTITLLRKDRLYGNTIAKFNQMVRGRFEGANRADFSDAELLHLIQKAPMYMDSVELKNVKNYRYVRYVAAIDRVGNADIAELEFYTAGNKKLSGTIIGIPGVKGNEAQKAMDGDWDSYYKATQKKNAWLGFDFGTAQPIVKIRFCPRNDTNVIIPSNDYMLFYWQNKWVKAGVKKATAMNITFDNIPVGAVLWLRCITGGKEENPFIMQNGKQVFL